MRNLIYNGLRMWEEQTCIRFIPKTHQTDYVEFIKEAGYVLCLV